MPRSAKDKIQQGTRRYLPAIHRFVNATPPTNSFFHLFQFGTNPPAGTYAGSALARSQVVGGSSPSPTTGIITLPNPTSPNKQYLTRASLKNLVANGTGRLYLIDLLVSYNGIPATTTTPQPMTSSAVNTDQRPRTANRFSQMFVDVTTALGATPANITVSYTHTNDLTAGARSTGAQALTTSAVQARIPHTSPFLPLQAGDDGVASIQTSTMSISMGAGVFALCICDVLAVIDINTDQQPVERSYADDTGALIEIPSNAALSMIWEPVSNTASQRLQSTLTFSECDLSAA